MSTELQRAKWRISYHKYKHRLARRKRPLAEYKAAVAAKKVAHAAWLKANYVAKERRPAGDWSPAGRAAYMRVWRAANPEKRKAWRKERKIRKRKTIIAELMKLQRGRCAICRERLEEDFHLDHIIPRKLGGSNARSNLQLTHSTCNIVKGAKHPLDHGRSLGRLL